MFHLIYERRRQTAMCASAIDIDQAHAFNVATFLYLLQQRDVSKQLRPFVGAGLMVSLLDGLLARYCSTGMTRSTTRWMHTK